MIKNIFGAYDKNAEIIEREFGVRIRETEGGIDVVGENAADAKGFIRELEKIAENAPLTGADVTRALATYFKSPEETARLSDAVAGVTYRGVKICAKTLNQKRFIQNVKSCDITFAVGPAGTGKTFLAVAMAATALKRGEVDKLVLTRPAIESGEKLGFLPGDLQTKVDPYLRPLYDALFDMYGADNKLAESGKIEVAPLAYMRGRTLKRAFIILDEAQNTTKEQMKMFLTRLGAGSKMIITGDDTQIDLPDKRQCGLIDAEKVLNKVKGVAFSRLNGGDVVRHDLVARIVEAYENGGR